MVPKAFSFQRGKVDPCMYIMHHNNWNVLIAIYVDDILITGNDSKFNNSVLQLLGKSYSLTLIGPTKWLLGMQISYTENSITIDQPKYVDDTLQWFNMVGCKPYSSPAVAEEHQDRNSKSPADNHLYKEIVGSLIYLSVITCSDISFAVGKLAQHMQEPCEPDMVAALHVLCYLAATSNQGITYLLAHCNLSLMLMLIGLVIKHCQINHWFCLHFCRCCNIVAIEATICGCQICYWSWIYLLFHVWVRNHLSSTTFWWDGFSPKCPYHTFKGP